MTITDTYRQRCYRCMRPTDHCVCDSLPSVPTRTAVVVIQHPHERLHPFGTAKLIGLGMPNSRVHTVYGGLSRSLHCPLDLPADAMLLYPHPDAVELSELSPTEQPSTLVVLDGTWSHAKRLYRENPWLQRLRHVRIDPSEPSRYRIRKEPRPECLSTLEATIAALRTLEPETGGLDLLLAAFDRMIDRQIAHVASAERQVRHKHPKQKASRRVSPLFADPGLVLLYAESTLPGGDRFAPRELVQVVGARIDGDTVCEILVRPTIVPPSTAHLAHMGLQLEDVMAGVSIGTARERLRAALGDGPFAAWTRSSLQWSADLLPAGAARTVLKANYCNVKNHSSGLLDEAVAREALTPKAISCRGRAAHRLANALAVARWLRDRMEQP